MKAPHVRSHLAAIGVLALCACGGSTTPSTASATGSVEGRTSTAAASPPPTAAATSPGASAGATVMEVNAAGQGGAFEPAALEVAVGATVHFKNVSGNIHNVTFSDTSIQSSGVMSPGEVFDVTFPRAGTFSYRCTFHPGMVGTVTVK